MISRDSSSTHYLYLISLIFTGIMTFLCLWGIKGKDHFAAIPMNNDSSYYRNYGDRVTKEIQDRDILYHNIGKSIEYAKKADIIFIGHSMLLWGLREDLIEEFERKHHVKIYNLASAGDASGEFLRLVIKRWHLKPKLWIVNYDEIVSNFFTPSLGDLGACGRSSAISVVKYGRLTGYLHVAGRNLRWRLEDLLLAYLPASITKDFFREPNEVTWRSIKTGNWNLEQTPTYTRLDNPHLKLSRTECHTSPEEINLAKKYLDDIGGASILTHVPYSNFCSMRPREIARALQIETVIPPGIDNFTTADHGGHLDRAGAIAYTKFVLSSLERTQAFKKLERLNSLNGIPNENHASH